MTDPTTDRGAAARTRVYQAQALFAKGTPQHDRLTTLIAEWEAEKADIVRQHRRLVENILEAQKMLEHDA